MCSSEPPTPDLAGADSLGAERVRRAIAEHLNRFVPLDATVVVACSGGADSLALAAGLVGAAGGRRLAAATVDHGLQAGSAARAGHVAEVLTGLGYRDRAVLTVTVAGPGGPEAAARDARYAALREYAAGLGGAAVLLAHTEDDQAETVLLGLGRGSGPRSISGMRAWRAPWGRPLLGVTRADTENACRASGLRWWEDPQNADPAFTRVRLRRDALPLLDEVLGGGVRAALARTAELMAQDVDALDALAAAELTRRSRVDGSLGLDRFVDLPTALRRRVLRGYVTDAGAKALGFEHLARLERQAIDPHGPSQVRLPGAVDCVRDGEVLRIQPL